MVDASDISTLLINGYWLMLRLDMWNKKTPQMWIEKQFTA